MDRLSTLLAQFGMHASTFHSGTFYGSSEFAAPQRGGTLHLLGSGRLGLQAASRDMQLTEPSLIFMPRPMPPLGTARRPTGDLHRRMVSQS